jgi:hypothetical protein
MRRIVVAAMAFTMVSATIEAPKTETDSALEDPCAGRGARERLAVTPFAPPAPSFRWSEPVREADLLQLFGRPQRIDTTIEDGRTAEYVITREWVFADVTVRGSVDTAGDPQVWINEVEVRAASTPMQCGVAVGLTLDRLNEILGPRHRGDQLCTCPEKSEAFWLQQYPDPKELNPWASLCVFTSADGVVTRLLWHQESRC